MSERPVERPVDRSAETIQMRRPVFVDGSGRRDRRLRIAGWTVAALGAVYAVGVAVSVALAPGSPVGALPFGAVFLPPPDTGAETTPAPHADAVAEVTAVPTGTTAASRRTGTVVAPAPIGPAAAPVAATSTSERPAVAVTSQPVPPPPPTGPVADPSASTEPSQSTTPVTTPVSPPAPTTMHHQGPPSDRGHPGSGGGRA